MKTASLRSAGVASDILRLAKKKCRKGGFASAEATAGLGGSAKPFEKA